MRKFCSCYISDIALIGSTVDLQMETKFAMQHLTTMMSQGFKLIAVRQNLSFGWVAYCDSCNFETGRCSAYNDSCFTHSTSDHMCTLKKDYNAMAKLKVNFQHKFYFLILRVRDVWHILSISETLPFPPRDFPNANSFMELTQHLTPDARDTWISDKSWS